MVAAALAVVLFFLLSVSAYIPEVAADGTARFLSRRCRCRVLLFIPPRWSCSREGNKESERARARERERDKEGGIKDG